ncbi:hypothetical protein PVAP13_3KG226832 [Panicum virgatum]|uniref:Uncharacterized protein n=1 Tax=Panicum virgatum TaxID=38727 RepID=A0A8T0UYA2_PANVG|nr:hypothetical protein PVAP13_3KG226832 [Panicum virgatum]
MRLISSSGRPRLLAPPCRRPGAASVAARLQCPPEPLLGAGSSAATHAGQRARGRLAPPAATTGLSSPTCPLGHHGGEKRRRRSRHGGAGDRPATPPVKPPRLPPDHGAASQGRPTLRCCKELPTPHGCALREGDVWFLQVAVTSI